MTIPSNTILNADCLTALPALPENSIDFILTDPPYLVNYKSRDGRTVPNDDSDQWLLPAFHHMHRVLKDDSFCVSFYGWPKADLFLNAYRIAGFRVVGHFAFPKRYTSTTGFVRYQHECAHLLVKGTPWARTDTIGDVIDWTYSGNRFHPTEKPIQVLLPLIETFCPPAGLTLDPFAGSGSTLIAARMLGRTYLGIELSAEYHAIAQHRLRQNEAASASRKPLEASGSDACWESIRQGSRPAPASSAARGVASQHCSLPPAGPLTAYTASDQKQIVARVSPVSPEGSLSLGQRA